MGGFGWRRFALALLGMLFVLRLCRSSFGFASSNQSLLMYGDGRDRLAQVLMLSLATLLFASLLMDGIGRGAVAPVALRSVTGAFMFGSGMQLGSGCACGTPEAVAHGRAPAPAAGPLGRSCGGHSIRAATARAKVSLAEDPAGLQRRGRRRPANRPMHRERG